MRWEDGLGEGERRAFVRTAPSRWASASLAFVSVTPSIDASRKLAPNLGCTSHLGIAPRRGVGHDVPGT